MRSRGASKRRCARRRRSPCRSRCGTSTWIERLSPPSHVSGKFRPSIATGIELPGLVVVRVAERAVPCTPALLPRFRPVDPPVRPFEQHALHFPDILFRQPPVVITEHPEIDNRVPFDATGEIDVRVEVAERERA